MHIIIGDEVAKVMAEKYTILELDQIQLERNGPVFNSYCVVSKVPLTEIAQLTSWQHLHIELISNYRKQDWNFCEQAIEHLKGRWGGELDSFYETIELRLAKFKEHGVGSTWDNGVIKKYLEIQ